MKQSTRVDLVCPVCDRDFWVYRSQLEKGIGKFCSRDCLGISRRKPPTGEPRKCADCGLVKSESEFSPVTRRSGYQTVLSYCRDCGNIRSGDRKSKYKSRYGYSTVTGTKRKTLKNYLYSLMKAAISRHGQRFDYPSDLDIDWLCELWEKQGGLCALTGFGMSWEVKGLYSVSLDRINSGVGYIRSNIQLVCLHANTMKGKLSYDELLMFCESIVSKHIEGC